MIKKAENPLSIRTPLLAFERIFRRTGLFRKTCLFENLTDKPLGIHVSYDFPEHSWIQLMPVEGRPSEAEVEEDHLVLRPGRTRVHVLMNTDSSNFPYDRFRGRIYFQDESNGKLPQWLEISFEEIDELSDFEGYAAIDLGTSNSMVSLYHLRRDALTGVPWSPDLEDEGREIPSAVFLQDLARFQRLAEESCLVGSAALREYRLQPTHDPHCLQVGTKRLIGSNRVLVSDARGSGGYVDPVSILYMLGRFLRQRCQNHPEVRARLRRISVTFPPTWDYQRINRWKEVFRRLGFSDDELDLSLDEASAAGLFSIYQWTKDADSRKRLLQDLLPSREETMEGEEKGERYLLKLLSFDFGGGTIDLAFIHVGIVALDDIIRLRIALRGSDSLDFGGDQVTLAVFRILKRRLAMALADRERLAGRTAEEPTRQAALARVADDPGAFLLPVGSTYGRARVGDSSDQAKDSIRERWMELEKEITKPDLPEELSRAVDAVFPTRYWRSIEEPVSTDAKRNFGWLWEQAEHLKRSLFHEASLRLDGIVLRKRGDEEQLRAGIRLRDIPTEISGLQPRTSDAGDDDSVWVSIGEIYSAISEPLEDAMARARRLVGSERVDRIVLTGQSSCIPLVRRLFMSPRSEGGLGVPPGKIEFDERNAKAAVSKGACLLRVMRDTLVGFDVDVSDFKANLLADIFYKTSVGGRRVLFEAGPIDELHYVEDRPDPASFARNLAVFYGSPRHLLGQFDYTGAGEQLPEFDSHARETRKILALAEEFPGHRELLDWRDKDPQAFARIAGMLRDWPDRAIIAWMESEAAAGTPERPIYRYYLTRNRSLFAVRDEGSGGKRLFPVPVEEGYEERIPARDNPFSGVH